MWWTLAANLGAFGRPSESTISPWQHEAGMLFDLGYGNSDGSWKQ